MSQFKKKIFKKIFEANSDDVASIDGKKTQVMTEETFIPLMGQMWDKVKTKYKKRYIGKTFKFAEWCGKHYIHSIDDIWVKNEFTNIKFTTKELFEIWKKEQ